MRSLLIFVVLCVGYSTQICSQDCVRLTTGDKIDGKIESYRRDSLLVIRDTNGILMEVPTSTIQKVEFDAAVELTPEPLPRFFGFMYSTTSLSWNSNTGNIGEFAGLLLGGSVGGGFGTNFNPYLSAMIGTGVSLLDLGRSSLMTSIPTWVEGRAALTKRGLRPYLGVQVGYNFSLDKQTANEYERISGGIMLAPTMGIKLKVGQRMGLCLDAGLYMQRAQVKYTYFDWEGFPVTTADDLFLRRIQCRASLLF